jgi:NADH-quinone oxidoreductase subunit C
MNVIQELITKFGSDSIYINDTSTINGLSITTSKAKIKLIITYLLTHSKFTHLITITAIDYKKYIKLCYHFSNGPQILTVQTQLDNSDLSIASITDLTVGASLYEREVHDLFGVVFRGHPNLTSLFLPDDWPRDVHPLKKEWTNNKIKSHLDNK